MQPYRPESFHTAPPTPDVLQKSIGTVNVFSGICYKCDEFHNLHLNLGPIHGIIPRQEAALGIAEGTAKEISILSRVGKPVCFQVQDIDSHRTAVLSRRAAQADARDYFLSALRPGDVIPASVTSVTRLGAFCDIGCGFQALMRIDRCCISRLQSAANLFRVGQPIQALVLGADDERKFIHLTGREMLGTWEENAALFRVGQTVPGIVRSIMSYGSFVELAPNLSGLAEPVDGLQEGDAVSVYIRGILPDRHKVKLNILEKLPSPPLPQTLRYFYTGSHLDQWEYFPGSNYTTYF